MLQRLLLKEKLSTHQAPTVQPGVTLGGHLWIPIEINGMLYLVIHFKVDTEGKITWFCVLTS